MPLIAELARADDRPARLGTLPPRKWVEFRAEGFPIPVNGIGFPLLRVQRIDKLLPGALPDGSVPGQQIAHGLLAAWLSSKWAGDTNYYTQM